jgi:hypothetical protein
MKKIILMAIAIITSISYSQNCNIGNEDISGFDQTVNSFQANIIVGTRYSLESNGTLTSLNLFGKNTGAQVKMAVYTDAPGDLPGNLIAITSATTVGSGIISLPVTPTQLQPGYYWIVAIYDNDGDHTYTKATPEGRLLCFKNHNFSSPMPATGNGFSTIVDVDLAYFMEITCGNLEIQEINNSKTMSLFPNPTSDIINLNINKTFVGSDYSIHDVLGKKIIAGKLLSDINSIDISSMEKGVYYLKLISNNNIIETKKIVRK